MKKTLKVILYLITFLLILPILSIAGQHKVIRVVDGDTIVVNYQGKPEKSDCYALTPLNQSILMKNKTSQWERSPLITLKKD